MSRILIEGIEQVFRRSMTESEKAIAQIPDADLHRQINPQQNNIAVVVQHVALNLQSRFTDFLTTDGDKSTRDRESEFVDRNLSRADLLVLWEIGWSTLFATLANLQDEDLPRTVYIRRQPHTVLQALVRSAAHCSWHASQIALIAKHFKGEDWNYLTIAPGGTAEFNRKMGM